MVPSSLIIVGTNPAHEILLLCHGLNDVPSDRDLLNFAKQRHDTSIARFFGENPINHNGRNGAPEVWRVGVVAEQPKYVGKAHR